MEGKPRMVIFANKSLLAKELEKSYPVEYFLTIIISSIFVENKINFCDNIGRFHYYSGQTTTT